MQVCAFGFSYHPLLRALTANGFLHLYTRHTSESSACMHCCLFSLDCSCLNNACMYCLTCITSW